MPEVMWRDKVKIIKNIDYFNNKNKLLKYNLSIWYTMIFLLFIILFKNTLKL